MMYYYHYGHRGFAVALGYKGEHIKRWFSDYSTLGGDVRKKVSGIEYIILAHVLPAL